MGQQGTPRPGPGEAKDESLPLRSSDRLNVQRRATHRLAPKLQIFGGPNTSGDASTSKTAGKVPLLNRPDSPDLGVSVGAAPAGLRVGQLKMDMPPVFTASRQQNVRGWLMKMERYFRLMHYPAETWVEVVATRLTEAAEAWFNGESQRIETGARRAWRSWAAFS